MYLYHIPNFMDLGNVIRSLEFFEVYKIDKYKSCPFLTTPRKFSGDFAIRYISILVCALFVSELNVKVKKRTVSTLKLQGLIVHGWNLKKIRVGCFGYRHNQIKGQFVQIIGQLSGLTSAFQIKRWEPLLSSKICLTRAQIIGKFTLWFCFR